VNAHGGNWLTALLPFAVLGALMFFRLRSMGRERPLKVRSLWVVPAVYVVLVGASLIEMPPTALGWALLVAGALAGCLLGWHRGKLIRIERNPETGALSQQASPLAMLLLVAIIALKLGARQIFGDSAAGQPGSNAMLLTDTFIGFALGLLSATRLELYFRARNILAHG
jgi:hypothetical protein